MIPLISSALKLDIEVFWFNTEPRKDILGEIIEGIGPGSQTVVYTTIWIFIAIFGIAFLGLLIWWSMFRRKSNLKVEIKLPRSDGKIINGEWGKGSYDAVKGVVYIKRPGYHCLSVTSCLIVIHLNTLLFPKCESTPWFAPVIEITFHCDRPEYSLRQLPVHCLLRKISNESNSTTNW